LGVFFFFDIPLNMMTRQIIATQKVMTTNQKVVVFNCC